MAIWLWYVAKPRRFPFIVANYIRLEAYTIFRRTVGQGSAELGLCSANLSRRVQGKPYPESVIYSQCFPQLRAGGLWFQRILLEFILGGVLLLVSYVPSIY